MLKKSQEVNLYSQRHYKVDEKQYENFTKKTGIKVNYIKANADELLERLKNEGKTVLQIFSFQLTLVNYKKVLNLVYFKKFQILLLKIMSPKICKIKWILIPITYRRKSASL